MNPEPLKGKETILYLSNEEPAGFFHHREDPDEEEYRLFWKEDVASAVAWLKMMICHCKNPKCRHRVFIDDAFPDVKEEPD